ncbi:MAG: fibronectin type III-like domain-contianing protein, partial [Bacteroidetes bacterium]|nr:fibronectin type III-like domain-contianing protein [Bacteroidota bacterium]
TNKKVTITVSLKNIGKRQGTEVVQLYIRDLVGSITRPVRELKGFELVSLAPGASQEVTFALTDKELGYFNNQGNWIIESGKFDVFVGGSSAAVNQTTFEIK